MYTSFGYVSLEIHTVIHTRGIEVVETHHIFWPGVKTNLVFFGNKVF